MKNIMIKLRNIKILWKLVISYIIIISIPLSILSTYIFNLYQNETEKNYTSIVETHLGQLKYNIEKVLSEAKIMSDYIVKNEQVTDYLRNYQNNREYYDFQAVRYMGGYLNSISQINPNIYSMHIFIENEDIPRYQRMILPIRYIKDEKIFNSIKSLGYKQTHWDSLHDERNFKDLNNPNEPFRPKQVFSFYQKVYRENQTDVLGYLELNITSKEIFNIITSHSFDSGDISILAVDGDGDLIHKTQNSPDIVPQSSLFKDYKPNELNTVYANNKKFVYRTAKISDLDIQLMLLYPYENIASATRTRMFSLLILLISGFATISLVIYFISNLIFKRLNTLTKQMKKVQHGNFDIPVKIGPDDEVGLLEKAFSTMLGKINTLINSVYKAQISEKEAKLSYLQAQMNPHFLFNSLEALRMTAEVEDNSRVSEGLFSLSKVLKAHIHSKTLAKLNEEVDIVNCYVYVQNLRLNNRLQLEMEVEEGLEEVTLPALTLQPLVENSIIHGLKFKPSDCRIKISVRSFPDQENIYIDVVDNGIGIQPETIEIIKSSFLEGVNNNIPSKGNGIALFNIHERIKLYYGSQYGLTVTSIPNIETKVSMYLPKRID
jgi:two-component system, sensor histidine kinase YesM